MRAKRRHHLMRMKAKAARLGADRGLPGAYAKVYDHLAYCSCYGCGNPRRHFGRKRMPERRAELARPEEWQH